MLTVYAQPQSQATLATTRDLERLGVPFRLVDTTVDLDAVSLLNRLGLVGQPAVVVTDPATGEVRGTWTGHRPDLIAASAAAFEAERAVPSDPALDDACEACQ